MGKTKACFPVPGALSWTPQAAASSASCLTTALRGPLESGRLPLSLLLTLILPSASCQGLHGFPLLGPCSHYPPRFTRLKGSQWIRSHSASVKHVNTLEQCCYFPKPLCISTTTSCVFICMCDLHLYSMPLFVPLKCFNLHHFIWHLQRLAGISQ